MASSTWSSPPAATASSVRSRATPSWLSLCREAGGWLLQQELLDERHRGVELEVLVLLLAEAVALVLRLQVPDRRSLLLQLGHHLLRFRVVDARVVLPLHDEDRLPDAVGVVERRNLRQELAHLRVALVSVLDAAQVAAIGLGVLQEGDEA